MGRILESFISDNLGKPVLMIGAGRILQLKEDYSLAKRSERLVLNVLIEFDDKTLEQVVIKLGVVEEDFKTKYDSKYTSKLSGVTYTNSSLENQFYHETIIADFFKQNVKLPQINDKILPILGAGIVINNNIIINGETFNLRDLGSLTRNIDSRENITYLVTEYNRSFKTLGSDGIPISWLSEIPSYKIYNLITSGIDILEYTYGKYKFCHWDFHGQNIIYDDNSGLVKLFDFDLSTIGIFPMVIDSQYIDRVDYFYTLINNIRYSQGIFSDVVLHYDSFENIKYMLAHYFDLFQFLNNIKPNIEQASIEFSKLRGELPYGWTIKKSLAGESYYYEIASGKSQFEFPSEPLELYLPDLGLENISEYNKLIDNFKLVNMDYKRLIELKTLPLLQSKYRLFLEKNPRISANPSRNYQFSSFILNLSEQDIQEFQPLEINFINFMKQNINDTGESIDYIRAVIVFCGALLLKYDFTNLSTRIEYIISKLEQNDEVPVRDHDEAATIDHDKPPGSDDDEPSVENFEKITREIVELKQKLNID